MRKLLGIWLLVFCALGGTAAPARANHCGICRYPNYCIAPEQCEPVPTTTVLYQPVIEQYQQVCYRPVVKTCYQPETFTAYRTVSETTCVPECYSVQRPVLEYFDTCRSYTVQRPVYETHLESRCYT